jgi:hypothetical protein
VAHMGQGDGDPRVARGECGGGFGVGQGGCEVGFEQEARQLMAGRGVVGPRGDLGFQSRAGLGEAARARQDVGAPFDQARLARRIRQGFGQDRQSLVVALALARQHGAVAPGADEGRVDPHRLGQGYIGAVEIALVTLRPRQHVAQLGVVRLVADQGRELGLGRRAVAAVVMHIGQVEADAGLPRRQLPGAGQGVRSFVEPPQPPQGDAQNEP